MKLKYRLLTTTAVPPLRMTEHSAGFDLSADLSEALILAPGTRQAVPTGIAVEVPIGFEAQIRPRSGLALKLGLGILNSPGTIDADYRGEIKAILFNAGDEDIVIQPGMRVAQMVVCPVCACALEESEKLTDSDRADGGFGHTGH